MVKQVNSYEYALLRLLQNYANPLARASANHAMLQMQGLPATNRLVMNSRRRRDNLRNKYYRRRNAIGQRFGRPSLTVQQDMNILNFTSAARPRTP